MRLEQQYDPDKHEDVFVLTFNEIDLANLPHELTIGRGSPHYLPGTVQWLSDVVAFLWNAQQLPVPSEAGVAYAALHQPLELIEGSFSEILEGEEVEP